MFDLDIIPSNHNRYLKGLFAQIREEGLTEELFHDLSVELKHASFINPTFNDSPLCIERDGKHYILLFSTLKEFRDDFPDFSSHTHLSFDTYLEFMTGQVDGYVKSKSESINTATQTIFPDGFMIDPSTDGFIIEGEEINRLFESFNIDMYSFYEVRQMVENMDNAKLNDLLSQNPLDWDEIITQMGSATLLSMRVCSRIDGHHDTARFLDSFDMNPLRFNKHQAIYTTKDFTLAPMAYAVVVSLMEIVEFTLEFGLSGISVFTPNGKVFMSRQLLVEKYELIERCCNDEKLKKAYNFLFSLKEMEE